MGRSTAQQLSHKGREIRFYRVILLMAALVYVPWWFVTLPYNTIDFLWVRVLISLLSMVLFCLS